MELANELHIEIFHTLEKIERINRHIAFHKSAEQPDLFAIEQWQEIKHDLMEQLQDLLAELDVPMQLAMAA